MVVWVDMAKEVKPIVAMVTQDTVVAVTRPLALVMVVLVGCVEGVAIAVVFNTILMRGRDMKALQECSCYSFAIEAQHMSHRRASPVQPL